MLPLIVRRRPLIRISSKSLVVNRRLIRCSGSLAKPLHRGCNSPRRSNKLFRVSFRRVQKDQKLKIASQPAGKAISSLKKKKDNKGRAVGSFTWYKVEVPGKWSGQAVMRERKKSDASSLYVESNRRGHFIDFRLTFHVAQLAEFSGCVTAENGFFLWRSLVDEKSSSTNRGSAGNPMKLPHRNSAK